MIISGHGSVCLHEEGGQLLSPRRRYRSRSSINSSSSRKSSSSSSSSTRQQPTLLKSNMLDARRLRRADDTRSFFVRAGVAYMNPLKIQGSTLACHQLYDYVVTEP